MIMNSFFKIIKINNYLTKINLITRILNDNFINHSFVNKILN